MEICETITDDADNSATQNDADERGVYDVHESLKLCNDGAYRWVYEFSLWRNPTIMFTLLKFFFAIVGIGSLLLTIALANDYRGGYASMSDVLDNLGILAMFILGFFLLFATAYALYAALQGGTYCVLFTMDEHQISYKQLPKQYKKEHVIAVLNVMAGAATGGFSQTGIGITSNRDSLTSSFQSVRRVKGSRRFDTIKVSERFAKYHVYVNASDYDFVINYIAEHCPNAKVKGLV